MTINYLVGFLLPCSSLRGQHTLECNIHAQDLVSEMNTFWMVNFYHARKPLTWTKKSLAKTPKQKVGTATLHAVK